jgi:hypothetical protein
MANHILSMNKLKKFFGIKSKAGQNERSASGLNCPAIQLGSIFSYLILIHFIHNPEYSLKLQA